MEDKNQLLIHELKRTGKLARMWSNSSRPEISLKRIAQNIDSIIAIINEDEISENNPLTNREKEIFQYVSQGFTNKDIANALSISEKTIEFHMKSILLKSQSANRTEAVRNAIKNGWLD